MTSNRRNFADLLLSKWGNRLVTVASEQPVNPGQITCELQELRRLRA